ncbi:MAG: hypothetical protein P857_1016 [Candidatus Xenolissoclinum pacificiensis L6]|uniref:Flagellar hook-associated protein 1 n=1 Tax=Candidatus Xenolissoclinum pacificiensis L6 TaxID=1401685 RepID=W2V310_9RICK|nr:MAG: hypothetical protein P857_1016 [Candidatus Xenolissoclinum pacificiensis L6]
MSIHNTSASITTGIMQQQEKMFVNSHNMLNADDVSYQKINVETNLLPSGYGTTKTFLASNDPLLNRDILENISITNYYEELSRYCKKISGTFGRPDSTSYIQNNAFPANINTALNNVFKSLSYLQADPNDMVLKSNLVNSASILTQMISNIAKDLNMMSSSVHQEIIDSSSAVNDYMKQIHDINRVIISADNITRNTLESQRNSLLEQIAQYLSIRVVDKDNNQIYLYTADNDIPLIEQDLYQMSYNGDRYLNPDNTPILPDNLSLQICNINSPAYFYEVSMEELTFGKMKGLYDADIVELRPKVAELNKFTECFIKEYNAIYNQGNSVPGKLYLNSYTSHTLYEDINLDEILDISLIDKRTGNPATYSDGYFIKPLSVDLRSNNINDLILEINNYFTPLSNQVVFSDMVRDVVLCVDEIDNNLVSFGIEIDSVSNQENPVFIEDIITSYTVNGVVVSSDQNVDQYNTVDRFSREHIGNLFSIDKSEIPTNLQKVNVNIKVSINGIEGMIGYDIYFNELYDSKRISAISSEGNAELRNTNNIKYATAALVADDGHIIANPYDMGYLKISSLNSEYAININSSNSDIDNFLSKYQFDNFFSVQENTLASKFSVESKIIEDVSSVNTAEITMNEDLQNYVVGPGNNLNILHLLSLQGKNILFTDTELQPHYYVFNEFLSNVIIISSQRAISAESVYEVNDQYLTSLRDYKYNITGVNLDEALIEQKRINQISQSLMRALAIYNENLENLINLL